MTDKPCSKCGMIHTELGDIIPDKVFQDAGFGKPDDDFEMAQEVLEGLREKRRIDGGIKGTFLKAEEKMKDKPMTKGKLSEIERKLNEPLNYVVAIKDIEDMIAEIRRCWAARQVHCPLQGVCEVEEAYHRLTGKMKKEMGP